MTGDPASMSARAVRSACRAERFDAPTAGYAMAFAQANLVVLRARDAADFERFCRLNPRPCPILEILPPGTTTPRRCAPDADVRTDLPRYRVFERGACVQRPRSITQFWRDDFVAFLIGCSFTFEWALRRAGVPVRHVEERRNVPMYRTNLPCAPAGTFATNLVVSMRPMTPDHAETARRVTAAYPRVHGAPLHVGDPDRLGITDLARPDFGDAVTIRPGEVPVFWACGVTPMEAIRHARPDVAITHEPGHMLVTDLTNESLREDAPQLWEG